MAMTAIGKTCEIIRDKRDPSLKLLEGMAMDERAGDSYL
jgi:hypothetical protein